MRQQAEEGHREAWTCSAPRTFSRLCSALRVTQRHTGPTSYMQGNQIVLNSRQSSQRGNPYRQEKGWATHQPRCESQLPKKGRPWKPTLLI